VAAGDRGGDRRRVLLETTGLVDLGKSYYTASRVAWASHLVGGFLFGFGMTLASGCGSKVLIRTGAGSLKSLLTLVVLAIAAYMTLKGLFAVWRVNTLDTLRLDTSVFGAARSRSRFRSRSPPHSPPSLWRAAIFARAGR
jgi:uncharacterized membrane protein YedE/YeeE